MQSVLPTLEGWRTGESVRIFGCVIIWEIAYNIFFIETSTRIENHRLERLKKSKITFIKTN